MHSTSQSQWTRGDYNTYARLASDRSLLFETSRPHLTGPDKAARITTSHLNVQPGGRDHGQSARLGPDPKGHARQVASNLAIIRRSALLFAAF